MLTTKGWIISSGVVAVALVVPLTFNMSVVTGTHDLKLFFVINGIVFVLAASSLLTRDHDHDRDRDHHPDDEYHHHFNDHDHLDHDHHSPEHEFDHHSPTTSPHLSHDQNSKRVKSSSSDVHEAQKPGKLPPENIPVALVRAAVLRRPLRPTAPTSDHLPPPGSGSRVETETMEEAWEKIKAENHMTKSNTWRGGRDASGEASSSYSSYSAPPSPSPSQYNVKKGGMLIERIPTWLRMKKEGSMGGEDLNARVEAFIKKFQEDMRLQRLESLRRYKSKLLKRGVKR